MEGQRSPVACKIAIGQWGSHYGNLLRVAEVTITDTTYILCTEHCVCIKGMHVCTYVMLILVIVSTLGSFIYKIHSLYHSFLYVVDDITQIHCWVDYVGCANNYHTSQTLGYTM